jgi:acetyl esterase
MRDIAPMNPEAQRVLEIIMELEGHVVSPVPIEQMRALMSVRTRTLAADPPEVGRIVNRDIDTDAGTVPVRIYYPNIDTDKPLPAFIYCHGGGFVVGDCDMVETICSTICQDAAIIVASVNYRLAPEHPFPAGLEDTMAVIKWIAGHSDSIGTDTNSLAVGGDSAGGNLAAAALQVFANELGDAIRYQVLVYPVTDLTCGQASYEDLGTGYPLTKERMANYIAQYLGDPSLATDPHASPLLAETVADQPPALVIVAGLDPLVDEGVAYGERLRTAGVAAEIIEVADHPHGFLGWTRDAQAARDMLALIGQRLREHLHG